MALQRLKNSALYYPNRVPYTTAWSIGADYFGFGTPMLMDASGEKVQMIGTVEWDDGSATARTIDSVIFLTGTCSGLDVNSSLEVSLQASGSTSRRSDGTKLRYGATTCDNITSNTLTTITMSTGSQQYATGDQIAIVWEITPFTGVPSIEIKVGSQDSMCHDPAVATASANFNRAPLVLLKSGSNYATLRNATYYETYTETTFDSATSPDEYGMKFTLPFDAKTSGIWLTLGVQNSASLTATIYSAPTTSPSVVVQRTGVDTTLLARAGSTAATNIVPAYIPFTSEVTLNSGTEYGVAIYAETTNDLTVTEYGVSDNAYMGVLSGGTGAHRITRSDQTGAFTATNTVWLPISVVLTALDDGAGGTGNNASRSIPLVIK